jgi:acetylornithine deacetylase/succinyl-diaminopimelate desuccinylase-like protein
MRECAEFISNKLRSVGFTVAVDKLQNVYGTKESALGNGTFLINTHFDTVAPSGRWTRDALRLTMEGDRLYGLGTADAKGGVAAILHVLGELASAGSRNLRYSSRTMKIAGRSWTGRSGWAHHTFWRTLG